MLDRAFRLSENGTTVRTELLGGSVTFLTMSYIIFVQPAVLTGQAFGTETGIDFDAVMAATCLSAALATALMALYARYPIAQAPGMGQNFFFVLSVVPAATAAGFADAWQVALGSVFLAGVIFLVISVLGLQEQVFAAVSPSMKSAIAVGIGLLIAVLGLQNSSLVLVDKTLSMNPDFRSPDLIVFFVGLALTASLHVRGVRGSIFWGILATLLVALGLRLLLDEGAAPQSMLMTRFEVAERIVTAPPSLEPTFLKMDLAGALSVGMLPFILIFLIMDFFDTMGTLVGVGERAGFIKDNRLPRAGRAMQSDAVGTLAGACLGTSTVTSFIESAAGIQQGARTGLAGVATAVFFLIALFFSPVVAMVGSYPPITAPALVIVGSLMIQSVRNVEWTDFTEALPAFLTILGIPATSSVADGLSLGLISYPLLKVAAGRAGEVHWLMYLTAGLLALYFVFVRAAVAGV
jgi:AGZA family xanthine/uracil permease-like MFS transporter